MSEPIDLAAHRRAAEAPTVEQHLEGPARCIACGHRWHGVAPVGTTRLECSACHGDTGAWVGMVLPPVGAFVWTCGCGNDLFSLHTSGPVCARCGVQPVLPF